MITHSVRCTVERTSEENEYLKQKLSRFWEIENVNPFDECVINQYEKDIAFNGERYVQDFLLKKSMIILKYVKHD